MNQTELLKEIHEILKSNCDDPIDQMRRMGKAMIDIANALEGQSIENARAIISACVILTPTFQEKKSAKAEEA